MVFDLSFVIGLNHSVFFFFNFMLVYVHLLRTRLFFLLLFHFWFRPIRTNKIETRPITKRWIFVNEFNFFSLPKISHSKWKTNNRNTNIHPSMNWVNIKILLYLNDKISHKFDGEDDGWSKKYNNNQTMNWGEIGSKSSDKLTNSMY